VLGTTFRCRACPCAAASWTWRMRPSSTEQPQGADARPGKVMAGLGKLYKGYIMLHQYMFMYTYIYIYIILLPISTTKCYDLGPGK